MLPPILRAVHEDLKNKGVVKRTRDEDALLAELEWLDRQQLTEAIEAAQRGGTLREWKQSAKGVLVDSGKCPCCGS